jgi:hypothetical protein
VGGFTGAAPRVNAKQAVRDQGIADGAAVDGGGLVGKVLRGRESLFRRGDIMEAWQTKTPDPLKRP